MKAKLRADRKTDWTLRANLVDLFLDTRRLVEQTRGVLYFPDAKLAVKRRLSREEVFAIWF